MGRLLQAQRRGKGKAGIESADRSPAHQRQNRILREPREIQERQARQECRHCRHVQATPYFTLNLFLFSFYSGGMANVDVVNLTWDMINEKKGMIVYERTKFPKLAKPLLIDRLIVILEKYRGKGIGNYVFPVYIEKHVTDKQKMGRRNNFSTLVSETLDKVCGILGIDEKMTWYTARGTFISSELDAGTPITHVAEMAGNSARIIEKHYYKTPSRKNCVSA